MSRPDVWTHNGVLVLTGDWLAVAAQAVKIAQRARHHNGAPPSRDYQLLADALMSAAGHSDVRTPATLRQFPHELPTITVPQAAEWLGRSERQIRRTAGTFGGRKIGGRWLLDEHAVRSHITDNESTT